MSMILCFHGDIHYNNENERGRFQQTLYTTRDTIPRKYCYHDYFFPERFKNIASCNVANGNEPFRRFKNVKDK